MALSRQGSLFDISEDSITRALGGDTSPRASSVSELNTAAEVDTLESDGEGFGAEQANARANQSEFSEKDPKTAAAAAEKWRRDVNSPLNIGGGGGALYTADKNPFSDGDNDDAANDALGEMVETSQQSLKREREEMQRIREEKFWRQAENDNTPSTDYPGLTIGQVLRGFRVFSENPDKYADIAVKNGWIKEGEQDGLKEYMRLKEWLARQQYLKSQGKPNELDSPQGVANQQRIDQMRPQYEQAAQNVLSITSGARKLDSGFDATVANEEASIEARSAALTGQTQTNPSVSVQTSATSVASTVDGAAISGNTPQLKATFNPKSSGVIQTSQTEPTQEVQVARNVGFAMSAEI